MAILPRTILSSAERAMVPSGIDSPLLYNILDACIAVYVVEGEERKEVRDLDVKDKVLLVTCPVGTCLIKVHNTDNA